MVDKIAGRIIPVRTVVGTTATPIPATAPDGRASILVTNEGAVTVYLGDGSVTTGAAGNGTPLVASEKLNLELGDSVVLYGRVASGSCVVKSLEGV